MTLAIRQTVRSARDLTQWAARAEKGQPVTYHIGDLSRDRAESPALHLLAETVLILAETGFLATRQVIMRLPLGAATWYFAHRTGAGWAPRSIMFDQCDAFTYRALQGMMRRSASQSASRAIRDHIGCSDAMARDYLADLQTRNWIEPCEPKGWQLSPEGIRMLT